MDSIPPPEESLTVLVADDILTSRLELMKVVRDLGHEPLEAASGEEALRLIDLHHPDVLLLDLLMPEMDGFEVASAVRQRITGKWLPVIVLSALEGDEHFAHALASGAADYLLKPVSPSILRAKLRQYQRVLAMQTRLALMVQRQHAIHEHITDAIITIDAQGRICELNRAARALFSLEDGSVAAELALAPLTGLSLQELLGQPTVDIGPHAQTKIPFSVSHNRWSIGHQDFCTIALHDLSESRRIERMKDEFLATVSHELRTPLTSILGALGLLAVGAGGMLPGAAIELLQVAKRNGDRLSQLIDDVLDLTKLEGKRMQLNLRPVELAPLIREALSAITAYAQRGAVSLAFEDEVGACRAQIDPDRFLQVMANLLSNAIKHSPKGKTVRVVLTQGLHQVQVEVMDEGPGIDPAFKEKLFEKFSQADGSDRRPTGGTGLGLYISRMLVEKMGGTVGADSGATGGSTFRVSLPNLNVAPSGPWILCIAQDRQLLDRMADWLAGLATVEAANNLAGAEALVRRLGPPAALLANPQAQGPAEEFCARLQQMLTARRIILMSDSLNAGFAARYSMGWLSATATMRQEIMAAVSALLADTSKGPGDGSI
jgi:signal transduction histidine kinase